MLVTRIEAAGSAELLEGPHWDPQTESLYFVDICGQNLYKYTPKLNLCQAAHIFEGRPSIIIPVEGAKNKFVVSVGTSLAVIEWDGCATGRVKPEIIARVEEDCQGHRINDGKCDPEGRLWFGTLGNEPERHRFVPNRGCLYSLQQDGLVKSHLTGITVANGLAWNEEKTLFYYIDSPRKIVDQFEYDNETGTIGNRKPIFTLEKHGLADSFPDGMTIDTDGNLWIAVFGASCVIKIDPRRPETLLLKVQIPAKQVTSVAWGGPNLDELYVTSANSVVDGQVLGGMHNGGLFKVSNLGAKGFPAINVKIK